MILILVKKSSKQSEDSNLRNSLKTHFNLKENRNSMQNASYLIKVSQWKKQNCLISDNLFIPQFPGGNDNIRICHVGTQTNQKDEVTPVKGLSKQ